jgi:DNA-binding MarR family transcriptional regulator
MPTHASTTRRPTPVPRSTIGHGGIPVRRAAAPLVRRLQQICVSFVAEALEGSGLVQLEYALMVFVDDVPGIDQRRLSEALGIDRNNVSLIVDRLETRGLVKRAIGVDRRSRHLSLTSQGKSLRYRYGWNTRVTNDRILAPLKAGERKQFLDMLVRLVEAHHLLARPGTGRRKRGSGNGKE